MASIDKVANGYRARWRTPDGASRSKTFPRKADAERHLDFIRGDLVRGTYIDTTLARKSVRDYSTDWVKAQAWRPSTLARTESVLKNHIYPTFGDRGIGSIRRTEVQAWVRALVDQKLAAATVEGTFRLLASLLRAAVADRIIPYSPTDGVKLPRRDGVMVTPLTVAEVESLADAIVPELQGAVLLAALTGLRQGELFGLTEDRVRWLKREVVVDRQLVTEKGGLRLGPCKTARSVRVVPLADQALQVLTEQVATYGVGGGGFLFHRDGDPWRRNRAATAMRDAGGSGWHALRHHCASVLIAQGLSVTAVAAVLGHSPAECLATYAAWWPSEDESIRAALSRAWTTRVMAVSAAD